MLNGCTPWPDELAEDYRRRGLWEGRTLHGLVRDTAARRPAHTALIEGERRLDYATLVRRAETAAARLHRAGLKPLDRVVMQLPNSIEFVVAYLALVRLGAIPVMALRAHRESEILHFVRASGATAYLIPDLAGRFDYRPMAASVARQCPGLQSIFVLGEPGPGQQALAPLLAEADEDRALAALPEPASGEVATMLLSGGTTSMSKLIPRTHDDYVLNARLCGQAAGFDERTVLLILLPLGHNYNLASPGLLGAFYRGGTVVLGDSMDAEAVFPLVERHRVSVIPAAVPLIANWLASPVPAACDLSSLRVVQNGGARLAPELRRRIRAQWGAVPQEIYGTAEGLINMTRLDDPDELVLESSGAPVCDDDEIKVVDDQGCELPDGEAGELLTRGPYTVRGYYDNAGKNAEAFTADGFYRMGDIVRRRGRHVFAEGRRKDLINRGGEKISCEEVENLILRHPAVHQVALVAMPDPVFGEKACAFVVPRPDSTLTFDELVAFLRQQRIASFKLPERLELVDRLPTSPVGKVLKRQLREMIVERMARQPIQGSEA